MPAPKNLSGVTQRVIATRRSGCCCCCGGGGAGAGFVLIAASSTRPPTPSTLPMLLQALLTREAIGRRGGIDEDPDG